MEVKVDVIIPAYKPDKSLGELLKRLMRQTYPIHKVIIMNTEEAYWNPDLAAGYENVEVHHLPKARFDHGGTRRAAVEKSRADIFLCMTQDAMPKDSRLVESLVECFALEGVKAAYARQFPAGDCSILERYTRSFNYPEESFVKSREDLPRLGIKTYFCSNVCAAYDRSVYEELGGFVEHTIFNEDMIYAAGVIKAGYKIAYAASARVIHSHNYNCRQQFHRNFDLGVSQAKHPEIFKGVPSEGEGIKMVKAAAKYLLSIKKPHLLPVLVMQSGAKYMGYFLGKRYGSLPRALILACSDNKEYWTNNN